MANVVDYANAGFEEDREEKVCDCKKSDAWRCAVDKNLITVSCHCLCHRRMPATVRGRADTKENTNG